MRNRVVALTLAASMAGGCGDSPSATEPEPETDHETPTAVLSGPTRAFISYDGLAPLPFRSTDSDGDISERLWWYVAPDGSVSDTTLVENYPLRAPDTGVYVIHLEVRGPSGLADHDSLEARVSPSVIPDSRRPMVFRRKNQDPITSVVYRYGPSSSIMRVVHEDSVMDSPGMDDSERYLAIPTYAPGGSTILRLLDTQDGSRSDLLARQSVIRDPSWRPGERAIAITDDYRIPGRLADELSILIHDGDEWQEYWPGGVRHNRDFYGGSPAWSPDGTAIAMGNTRWGDDDTPSTQDRLVSIYENVLTNPTRRPVHTPEQLIDFFEKYQVADENYDGYFAEGSQGVGYSPDGRVAFNMMLSGNRNMIVVADPSGEEPLVMVSPIAGPLTWSADGNWIYFNYLGFGSEYDMDVIYRVHSGGEGLVERVTDGTQPSWY